MTNKRLLGVTIPYDGVPAFTIFDEELAVSSINIRWHNPLNPRDVDDDQSVSPLDVLKIIDQINKYGARQVEGVGEIFCDVDDDGSISPLDVLSVINWLNSQAGGSPSGEGEGASDVESKVSSTDAFSRDRFFAGEIDWVPQTELDSETNSGVSLLKRARRSSLR